MIADAARLAADIDAELRAILGWWVTHAVDEAHGGFHGEIDAANQPVAGAEKGVILNARVLYFFSAAAAHLNDPQARALADRAAEYLKAQFYDPVHGGVWWALDADGAPVNRRKQAYAQAFAIYGLVAHYEATGDADSAAMARALFAAIEARYIDPAHGGYIEALAEDWSPITDMRLSEVDANTPKSMNTHLHVLEAYTALHAALPDETTEVALKTSLMLMRDRIIDPGGKHVRLFFDMDWTDRSPAVSFGHDIETSWLLWEACEVLSDAAPKERLRPLVLSLARQSLAALGPDGGLHNERSAAGHLDARRVWWAQAEAIVGYLNAYELSRDTAFLDAFTRVWRFIQSHHRDAGGEWTWWARGDAGDASRAYKAGFWKGPYHNGRAMLECSRRLKRLAPR